MWLTESKSDWIKNMTNDLLSKDQTTPSLSDRRWTIIFAWAFTAVVWGWIGNLTLKTHPFWIVFVCAAGVGFQGRWRDGALMGCFFTVISSAIQLFRGMWGPDFIPVALLALLGEVIVGAFGGFSGAFISRSLKRN
mgnify:CR=1 FL=1